MLRAQATTHAITLANASAVNVAYPRALRERHYGDRQGTSIALWREFLKGLKSDVSCYKPCGGESVIETHERVLSFWQTLQTTRNAGTIVVSSHGAITRSLIAHVLGKDLNFRNNLEQDNACLNVFTKNSRGEFVVEKLNCVAHLSEPTRFDHDRR
jgi:broad specificity phosphatase PhoE